jgi:hypothetical protein
MNNVLILDDGVFAGDEINNEEEERRVRGSEGLNPSINQRY